MNVKKKELFWASLKGCIWSWLIVSSFPKEGVVYFNLESDRVTTSDLHLTEYKAKVRRVGNGELMITVEPDYGIRKYLYFGAFVVILGSASYGWSKLENVSENDSKPQDSSPDVEQPKDSVFELFLAEDEARRLVPRATLEKDFEDWKSAQHESESPEEDSQT